MKLLPDFREVCALVYSYEAPNFTWNVQKSERHATGNDAGLLQLVISNWEQNLPQPGRYTEYVYNSARCLAQTVTYRELLMNTYCTPTCHRKVFMYNLIKSFTMEEPFVSHSR